MSNLHFSTHALKHPGLLTPKMRTDPQVKPLATGWFVAGYCLLMAFAFLLLSSKSSPLYPFNDWTDANTFFTVGKGMFTGKVPYRDLFDQKGPLLYLIFGLGYLLSHTTFLGVFLFEALSLGVFLLFSYRIMTLYLNKNYALIGLPLVAVAVVNLRSFGHGGSAEQFVLPLIAISLYDYLHYFQRLSPEPMPRSRMVISGLLAGCVLWIKFSLIGFWLAWITTILLSQLINKRVTEGIKSAAAFMAGMVMATLPWMVYFGLHQALRDWLEAYFVINLTAYPMTLTLRERIMVPIDSLQHHFSLNPAAVGVLLLGTIVFSTHRKYLKSFIGRLGVILMAALLVLGVYGGGRDYIYYFFIFSAFMPLGVIVLLNLYAEEYQPISSKLAMGLILSIILAVTLVYTLKFQRNTYMLDWDREDMVQYRYANIIQAKPGATLLNYGFQDSGFYTAAGIIPNTRFFQSYNFAYSSYPLATDEQNRYIQDSMVDFIILRISPADSTENLPIPHLYENYQLRAAETQLFGETEFKYVLFEKIQEPLAVSQHSD